MFAVTDVTAEANQAESVRLWVKRWVDVAPQRRLPQYNNHIDVPGFGIRLRTVVNPPRVVCAPLVGCELEDKGGDHILRVKRTQRARRVVLRYDLYSSNKGYRNLSMFEIFAIIQDWYSGNHELASACLAANSRMTFHEAHAYLEDHGEEGMTVMFSRIVGEDGESLDDYRAILDNLVEMQDYLSQVIKDVTEEIDVREKLHAANSNA